MVGVAASAAATSAALAMTTIINATNTARMMQDPAYRKSILESKLRDVKAKIANEEAVLKYHFAKAKDQIIDQIDVSKLEVVDDTHTFEYKYFDKNGNLLMRESGWRGIIDKEITTEIYSLETGEKIFSNSQYSGVEGGSSCTKHYTKGVCDNDNFLKKCALKEKREKHRAKRRLLRMKTKKFFRDTFSNE